MRRLITTVAACGLVLAVAACPAWSTPGRGFGAHGASWVDEDGEPCPEYRTEDRFWSLEESDVGIGLLVAEGLYDASDRIDQPYVMQVTSLGLLAAQIADLVIREPNALANACYEPRHLQLEDELMKMTIQQNLAVTTTPDAALLFPEHESQQATHEPPFPARAGFLTRERDDGDNPNESEGDDFLAVQTSVREVIDAFKELGQCTCTLAESSYAQAVSAAEAGSYKQAYRLFRQAYAYAFSN